MSCSQILLQVCQNMAFSGELSQWGTETGQRLPEINEIEESSILQCRSKNLRDIWGQKWDSPLPSWINHIVCAILCRACRKESFNTYKQYCLIKQNCVYNCSYKVQCLYTNHKSREAFSNIANNPKRQSWTHSRHNWVSPLMYILLDVQLKIWSSAFWHCLKDIAPFPKRSHKFSPCLIQRRESVIDAFDIHGSFQIGLRAVFLLDGIQNNNVTWAYGGTKIEQSLL